jgi:hypothetical protein
MVEHSDIGSLAGRWHLVSADCPERELPDHRVDLVFHDNPAGLCAAILSRQDGSEIPLQSVSFSGGELRVKMSVPTGPPTTDAPTLVMVAVGDRFEGAWDTPGAEHIRLKLIRA